MLFINFKIYPQTFGQGAIKLAEICKKVADQTGVKIIPVVSALDLHVVKEICDEVWLQHVDIHFQGKHTGYISPLAAVAAGAGGTLLNHSEHKIPPGQIHQILSNFEHLGIEDLNFGFTVCFKTKGQVKNWVSKLSPKPDFVAYEPPELIGTDVSVSQAQPEVIKRIVEMLPDYQVIVGAGVNKKEDVQTALKLGAKGVLVSSDVVIAENPEKELLDLANGF
jgi:triosephosphate isomerase (TIM)